jgi:hypothetical protein
MLTLLAVLAGCGKGSDRAQLELAQMNIAYTEPDFIKSAREGNAAAVSLFLDAGMNIEAKTKEGQTALMVAALEDHAETVKILLENGADVNAKNRFNGTASLFIRASSVRLIHSHCDTPCVRGTVICVNASNGQVIWTSHTAPQDSIGAGVWSSFAVDPSRRLVYVTSGNFCGRLASL